MREDCKYCFLECSFLIIPMLHFLLFNGSFLPPHPLERRLPSMETSQPLSIESFSYRWLVNLKPSLESLDNSLRASLDASDEASFIEMDPKMPPSKRFFRNSQDFKFDFPISQSPLTVVHADELFCNGYLKPLFVDPLKVDTYEVSDSNSAIPSSSHTPKAVVSVRKTRSSSLRRCRTLSKQIFQKYFEFLRPLYRRIRGHRSSSRAESMDTNVQVVKSWLYSAETSPRISVAYSVDDWRRSCDSESSIYEAVLHCKRSIGK
ncbi:probable membrane-associated kinase regulator 6 isoform X1 [Hevea brasiliensis]|uniref:probable membrane-associated kinase regulator 6 isoform X1 n=2 Tax=Hevea brasiliensis TaxID=3981 RepID=UPI0025DCD52B|nr:probable membrane-associated kinase regulator 6 isoform X1 [Hevea brasiliensis]